MIPAAVPADQANDDLRLEDEHPAGAPKVAPPVQIGPLVFSAKTSILLIAAAALAINILLLLIVVFVALVRAGKL